MVRVTKGTDSSICTGLPQIVWVLHPLFDPLTQNGSLIRGTSIPLVSSLPYFLDTRLEINYITILEVTNDGYYGKISLKEDNYSTEARISVIKKSKCRNILFYTNLTAYNFAKVLSKNNNVLSSKLTFSTILGLHQIKCKA